MTEWLWQQTLVSSALIAILLLVKRPAINSLSATGYYCLWLLLPTSVLLSFLPSTSLPPELNQFLVTPKTLHSELFAAQSVAFDLLFITWSVGAAALSLYFVIHYLWQKTSLQLLPISQSDQQKLGIEQSPNSCFYSDNISSPFVMGFTRQHLILPLDFINLYDLKQRRMILDHEACHMARGDLYWNLIACLMLVVFWFNPFAWIGYKVFRQSQEMACDQSVLSYSSRAERISYANTMVSIASQSNRNMLLGQINYGDRKSMEQRLFALKVIKPTCWKPIAALIVSSIVLMTGMSVASEQVKQGKDQVKPLMRIEPLYPIDAAEKGIEGMVVVAFNVDTSGAVLNASIVDSDPANTFDKSALDAVSQWRYQANSSQDPKTEYQVQLNFKLDAKPEKSALSSAAELEKVDVLPPKPKKAEKSAK